LEGFQKFRLKNLKYLPMAGKTFFEWMIIDSGPRELPYREYSWKRALREWSSKKFLTENLNKESSRTDNYWSWQFEASKED
jgi:hypothetical protein